MNFKIMIAIGVIGTILLILIYNLLTDMQCSGFKYANMKDNCRGEIIFAMLFMAAVFGIAFAVIRRLTRPKEDGW